MATISKENQSPQLASQDVGLIFVREYYTFLNKKPHRLHAFYNNDSTYIRGDEGKVSTTAKGQEEIRKKIEECQFQDCKVLITQVDSQASANNGILIQVLGEMSNQSGPSQKFSQTFFLATQTNGYYVLNDIFRFLKDEVDINYYTYDQAEPAPIKSNVVNATNNNPSEPAPTPKSPVTIQKPTTPQPEPVKIETKKEEEIVKKEEDNVVKKEKEEDEKVTPVVDTEVKSPTPEVQEEKKRKPENNKKSEQKPVQKATSPSASPTTPTIPSKPKTWANLTAASSNVEKSPSATAATIPATSTTPIPAGTTPTSTSSSTDVTPDITEKPTPTTTHHKSHTPRKDATQIFIKSVTEEVGEEELLEAFNKFGEVKSCNILRHKNCAFMEFTTSEGCQKALAQHKVQVNEGHSVLAEERRYNSQNTNRYNNQGRSFEQRRSNTGNNPRRHNNQQRQNTQKGRTTPQPQQQEK